MYYRQFTSYLKSKLLGQKASNTFLKQHLNRSQPRKCKGGRSVIFPGFIIFCFPQVHVWLKIWRDQKYQKKCKLNNLHKLKAIEKKGLLLNKRMMMNDCVSKFQGRKNIKQF